MAIVAAVTGKPFIVDDVVRQERKRNPLPPFITSTLQQEAARKLGFSTSRTMRVAQKLYEGVALGEEGTVGLISYMRTDSVHLSQEAVAEIRDVIARHQGELVSVGNPTTTLEELFLEIIRESEAHPGRRVRGGVADGH